MVLADPHMGRRKLIGILVIAWRACRWALFGDAGGAWFRTFLGRHPLARHVQAGTVADRSGAVPGLLLEPSARLSWAWCSPAMAKCLAERGSPDYRCLAIYRQSDQFMPALHSSLGARFFETTRWIAFRSAGKI